MTRQESFLTKHQKGFYNQLKYFKVRFVNIRKYLLLITQSGKFSLLTS